MSALTCTITPVSAQPALYDTAGTVVQRAALQIGLGNISDPYASTDPNVLQLCEFLRQSGDDLSTQHDWTAMVREATFTTDGVADTVTLPPDFYDFVDGTGWNRSTRWPLIGPLSPQDVQFLKARLVNVLIQIAYRKVGGNLVFPIIPGAGSVCAFEYQSTYWAQSAGASVPDKKSPTVSTDMVLYDADLMVAAVKLRWAEEKGFDTTLARSRYDEKLGYMIGKDAGGQSLGLAGRARPFDRMINADNVPPGNWGV